MGNFLINCLQKLKVKLKYSLAALLLTLPAMLTAQNKLADLKEKVTVEVETINAATLLQKLQDQTTYTFSFDYNTLKNIEIHDVSWRGLALGTVLKKVQDSYGLLFNVAGKNIAVRKATTATTATGRIDGQVMDEKNGSTLASASIRIDNRGITTDLEGRFSVTLPVGTYTVEVTNVGYQGKKITEVVVKADEVTSFQVTLTPAEGTLQEVLVSVTVAKESARALYINQKNNPAISDGISAEQIRVTPDNNAAQVLKRVSGLTIQDNKFVTIRGLSDRYNNVLLSGSMLPSTEPNRRNFAFDIIPSALIDNIVVNKTATPDMPSEFSGGLVQINTKDIPTRDYASFTIGTGFNNRSTGKTMYSTPRGGKDYLGYDDGTRNWWRSEWKKDEYMAAYSAGNYDKMGTMNRRIPNNWGLYGYDYSPVQNYQLNLGKRMVLKDSSELGITLAGMYRHEENVETDERNSYANEAYRYKGNSYQFRSMLGGIFNVGWKHRNTRLSFKSLYNHLFTNTTQDYYGPVTGFGNPEDITHNYLNLTRINELWQRRLEGSHVIGQKDIRLDWNADWLTVNRDQPDTRNSIGVHAQGDPKGYYAYPGINDRTGFLSRGLSVFNSRLEETRYNWGANISIPFTINRVRQKLKVGYAGSYREAAFENIGMSAVKDITTDNNENNEAFQQEIFGLPDYELLAPEQFKPGYVYYYPVIFKDDYDGIRRLHAGYVMLEAAFWKNFRLIGGVRVEKNQMDVNSEFVSAGTPVPFKRYNNTDWLPSANLVYALNDKMNLRLAYSETLSRPDFRERSAFQYYDFEDRNTYKGALGLKDTRIRNLDFRYEYYPGAGEVLAASVFYKKFEDPVELITAQSSSGLRYFFFNLASSSNTGVEIDFRKSLNFIAPSSGFVQNIYISGNASFMESKVKYNTDALLEAAREGGSGSTDQPLPPDSRERPLQGLSPYAINAGIGYFGKPIGLNINYNRYGHRIISGGLYPYMDQYENARDVLDIQLSTLLLKEKLEIRLNMSDLLQQPYIIYDNVKLQEDGTTGLTNEQLPMSNVNNDPKGDRYNEGLDFTRYKSLRGANFSINITYHL